MVPFPNPTSELFHTDYDTGDQVYELTPGRSVYSGKLDKNQTFVINKS